MLTSATYSEQREYLRFMKRLQVELEELWAEIRLLTAMNCLKFEIIVDCSLRIPGNESHADTRR